MNPIKLGLILLIQTEFETSQCRKEQCIKKSEKTKFWRTEKTGKQFSLGIVYLEHLQNFLKTYITYPLNHSVRNVSFSKTLRAC